MKDGRLPHIYGPVPSRRLGRSLGIDLVPFKTCTYDCIYCQLGRTTDKSVERKEHVPIDEVLIELEQKLSCGEVFDYISLAGSGEPTLNSGIGDLILKIKGLTKIPVAVLTNGSLLWMKEVQDELMPADLVLPSLDAGDKLLFQYVNRPHEEISFERLVDGLECFTNRFKGEVWLEVMLLAGVTGIRDEVEKIASIVGRISKARIQMNTVVRPPAEPFAKPLSGRQMIAFKGIFPVKTDIIVDRETIHLPTCPDSISTGDEIVSLISRRPCTSDDVACSLGLNALEALKYLDALQTAGRAATVRLNGKIFYATSESMHALRP